MHNYNCIYSSFTVPVGSATQNSVENKKDTVNLAVYKKSVSGGESATNVAFFVALHVCAVTRCSGLCMKVKIDSKWDPAKMFFIDGGL